MQARFNFELSHSEIVCKARNQKKNSKVGVVCCGVEGVYFPSLQLVVFASVGTMEWKADTQ
ncbi:hypothetical protein ACS0TY_001374 [Phlomoides rotata]